MMIGLHGCSHPDDASRAITLALLIKKEVNSIEGIGVRIGKK